jgi:hypothetical protein
MASVLLAGATLVAAGEAPAGPYARIAMFHPLDGHNVDFEAAYVRHLAWHTQARDTWTWYGYTINYSDRRYWFIYASFGHAAADFDNPVDPAGDDRDNTMNVMPHVESWKNGLYEFLPALSHGNGVPTPTVRAEMTTVEIRQGAEKAFEAAIAAGQPALKGETLWYRMAVGGDAPRYVRLRPMPTIAAALDDNKQATLPAKTNELVVNVTVELLNLRPNMSYNLPSQPSP